MLSICFYVVKKLCSNFRTNVIFSRRMLQFHDGCHNCMMDVTISVTCFNQVMGCNFKICDTFSCHVTIFGCIQFQVKCYNFSTNFKI